MKLPKGTVRAWRLLAGAAVGLLAMFGLRAWLGPGDWAGLGQWVGGLGAFAAAWVALDIAKSEARRENDRDAEARRVHAYYVSGGWAKIDGGFQLQVRNLGTEPVVNVNVIGIHARESVGEVVKVRLPDGPLAVLLNDQTWQPDWYPTETSPLSGLRAAITAPANHVEVTYEDLGGARWRRIGNNPPTPEPKVDHG